MGQMGGIMG
jgi:hypothetical protein